MASIKQQKVKEILSCGKDPKYFLRNYCRIQHPIKGAIPFQTFPFQDSCLDDFEAHRFNIILKSRQMGISTITAGYSLWKTIFYENQNILVIATKLSVAQNFIKKVKYMLASMPSWLVIPKIETETKQELGFSNGSTIKAIPTSEDAGRSEAVSLLIVDEAAFVRNFDEIWTGIYPTLSTGGNAIVLSTPNGVGGQYYDLWKEAEEGKNVFNPIKLLWNLHPERDQAWFEKETRNMSKKQIAQELLCDFAASGDTFLKTDVIEYMRLWVEPPMEQTGPENDVWIWEYPVPGREYIISADVSRGDSKDYSTFHVIDINKSEVVVEYKGKLAPDKFASLLIDYGTRYNKAMICPENNSYGYACIVKLVENNYSELWFANEKDKYEWLYGEKNIGKVGFQTNSKTRPQILSKLENVLRNRKIKVRSKRLYEEMKTFIWDKGKAQAMRGKNDDLIMALAIGCWLYECNPDFDGTNKNTDINKAMLAAFGVRRTSKSKIFGNNTGVESKINYKWLY